MFRDGRETERLYDVEGSFDVGTGIGEYDVVITFTEEVKVSAKFATQALECVANHHLVHDGVCQRRSYLA